MGIKALIALFIIIGISIGILISNLYYNVLAKGEGCLTIDSMSTERIPIKLEFDISYDELLESDWIKVDIVDLSESQ